MKKIVLSLAILSTLCLQLFAAMPSQKNIAVLYSTSWGTDQERYLENFITGYFDTPIKFSMQKYSPSIINSLHNYDAILFCAAPYTRLAENIEKFAQDNEAPRSKLRGILFQD